MFGPSYRSQAMALVFFLLLASGTLLAQNVRARGQIFLPNGQPHAAVTRFILGSEDTRRSPEYDFTDSKGWFYLQGLSNNRWYTITVETDGETYATTTVSFHAVTQAYVQVHLRPLETPKQPRVAPTVSTTQLGYQPRKDAARAYEQALQAIQKRQPEEAKQGLRRALELDPNYVSAYNELAVLEIGTKNYQEAEPLLRRALGRDPQAPHPLLNLGITLNYLGRHSEAIEPLRKLLQLRPNWVNAHTYLGIALLETDKPEEAEVHLKRGTQAEAREQVLAYLYLGKLYAQKGEVEKATATWKSYLERDPDSPNAARVRDLLSRLGRSPQKP